MKKIILILTVAVLCFGCVFAVACEQKQPDIEEQKTYNMVVLGDSIAEGVLGPSPISEKNDYTYCGIIGEINDFNYYNRAISGYQTFQMLDYISKETDQTAYAHITHIKQADIIVISMFGNDYIFADLNKLILEAVDNKSELRDTVLNQVRTNIPLIVDKLKELNPTATILWQSLYNPIYDGSKIIGKATFETLKEQYGIYGEELVAWGNKLVDALNQTLYEYLEEHPNAFEVLDVNKKFNDLYNANHKHLETLIYEDGVHPSNEGHSYIASALQSKLQELGFASKDAIANYKTLVTDRLNRLYENTEVNVEATASAIRDASDFDSINAIYFEAVNGIVPSYNHKTNELGSTENKRLVDEDVTFRLINAKFNGGINESLPLTGIIDKEKSFITLDTNGLLTMELHIDSELYELAKAVLQGLNASTLDVSFLDAYIHELFPGTDKTDVAAVFESIENTLGLSVVGLDFDDPALKEIADSLRETGKLPEKVSLPDDVYFKLVQPYELKHIDSLTVEGGFEAVYVGNYRGQEPYLIMTMYDGVWGEKTLSIVNEFLFLTVEMESPERE